jgi:hypothetical protein
MKTTVVPAQITTVEDRIAGNLTFPQIVLMIIPLLTGSAIYVLVPEKMHFSVIKLILIALQFVFFGGLAIRFRGKILADWLVIYLRFKARPRRYIFTKNDMAARNGYIKLDEKPIVKEEQEEKKYFHIEELEAADQIQVERLLKNPALSLSFKLAKRGGIDVSLKTNKS